MGSCMSTAANDVAVRVYTIVDGESDPLFGIVATMYGVTGVYLCTVRVGGKEYVFDAPRSRGKPAAAQPSAAGMPAAPAGTPRIEGPRIAAGAAGARVGGGIRSYRPRRVHHSSKPPADVHGADSVVGLKGEIPMGATQLTPVAIKQALEKLSATFNAQTYNLATCNPNHFADALCVELVGKGLPDWCNRAAGIGTRLGLDLDATLADLAIATRNSSSPPAVGTLRPTQRPAAAAAHGSVVGAGGGGMGGGGLFGARPAQARPAQQPAGMLVRTSRPTTAQQRAAEEDAAVAMVLGLATAMVAVSIADAILSEAEARKRDRPFGGILEGWFGGGPQQSAQRPPAPGAAGVQGDASRFEEIK